MKQYKYKVINYKKNTDVSSIHKNPKLLHKARTILQYNPNTMKLVKEWYSISSVCRALWYKEYRTFSMYLNSNQMLKGSLWYTKDSWT